MREGDNIRWPWVAVGFIVFILLAGLAGQSDYEDAVREEALYCANVALYKATSGEQGWPDYNKNYNEICKKIQNS
jgi:hypothetical protein